MTSCAPREWNDDWKAVKAAYVAWLDPDNFDDQDQQKTKLQTAARDG